MKHPDPEVQQYQADFLESCDPGARRFHELMFKVGNTTYCYHQEAEKFSPTEDLWKEWIGGLDGAFKKEMEERGFGESKLLLPFTRYVNEKNDVGLGEYLKKHLSPEELEEYNNLLNL